VIKPALVVLATNAALLRHHNLFKTPHGMITVLVSAYPANHPLSDLELRRDLSIANARLS